MSHNIFRIMQHELPVSSLAFLYGTCFIRDFHLLLQKDIIGEFRHEVINVISCRGMASV